MLQMLKKRHLLLILLLVAGLSLSVFISFKLNNRGVFQDVNCTRTCYNRISPGVTTRAELLSYLAEKKISPHKSYQLGDTTPNPLPLTFSWIPEKPEFFIQPDSQIIAVFGRSDVLQQLTIPTDLTIEDIRQSYPEPDYIYEVSEQYELVYEELKIIFIFDKSRKNAETTYLLSAESINHWISPDNSMVNWETFLSEINSHE